MSRLTRIYVLKDPRTNEVRYVGKTVQSLKRRLATHLTPRYTCGSHKGNWIGSLLALGLKPIIEQIEEAGDDWAERERFWIAHYRKFVPNLTNQCDGGEGVPGVKWTPARRAKKAAESRAASQSLEWKARMVASRPEWWSEDMRAQRAELVKSQLTPERRAAHSAALKAKMSSPEWKARHSIAMRSKWTPELRAAQAEKAIAAAKRPETKARRLAAARERWTPEARAAASETSKRVMTPEVIARNSAKNKARWTPELRAEWAERTRKQLAAKPIVRTPEMREAAAERTRASWAKRRERKERAEQ